MYSERAEFLGNLMALVWGLIGWVVAGLGFNQMAGSPLSNIGGFVLGFGGGVMACLISYVIHHSMFDWIIDELAESQSQQGGA